MFFGFDLIQAIQALGYPGIFAIVLAESGLFFGVSLPGGSMLFTAGLLASEGILNIWILLAVVIIAASLGDTIGYWFGAWVGPAIFKREDSRFFKKAYLERTRDFFDHHGARTIFLARFIPIVRTFAPILAGVANMRYPTFLYYNVLGAIVWGGGFTLAGYYLGEAIPEIEDYIALIVLGIMVVTFVPFLFHLKPKKRNQVRNDLPSAVIFDLDDTLAESFSPPSERIMRKLLALSRKVPVAIMSGADFARMERDILAPIERKKTDVGMFYVFSDNASTAHQWSEGSWKSAYHFTFDEHERAAIRAAVEETVAETDVMPEGGPRIVERESSIAIAALPEQASRSEKEAWDPDYAKRTRFADVLRTKLSGHEIFVVGRTTIDVVRSGVSKAYGVEWLAQELNLDPPAMLFVGDAFAEGGNDAVVVPTGIKTFKTSGPQETENYINSLLADFAARA
jgi:membrane-associated protein